MSHDSTADTPADENAEPADEGESLLLDRIDALRVVRANTKEEKGAILEQIAGHGTVEQELVGELSKRLPLWRPDRFEEAHRIAMRSLEVLDRNGARPAQMPRLGPLTPIAKYVVQQFTRWIVKAYQNTLVGRIRRLYERREANTVWGSPEHRMLRRARIDATRVEPGLRGNPLGLPTFLVGGAIVSTLFSAVQSLLRWALGGVVEGVILAILLALVFGFLAWAALYAAGVARRRIRLSTDQPIRALWETIGAAGNPPKDASYDFAVLAIVLLAIAWLLVPLAVWLVVTGI